MADKDNSKIEGEGSYTASADYQKSVRGFVDKNKSRIKGWAEDAEKALDGSEGEELRRAEETGEHKAKR